MTTRASMGTNIKRNFEISEHGEIRPRWYQSRQSSEMEKRKKIAQTEFLDQKIAQKMRNSRHIIIHAKTA